MFPYRFWNQLVEFYKISFWDYNLDGIELQTILGLVLLKNFLFLHAFLYASPPP